MKDKIIRMTKSIGLLLAGLFLGWLIFGSTGNDAVDHSDHDQDNVENNKGDIIWTCSMHPQIRQKEPGDCPICGMDLIPVDNNSKSEDQTIIKMSESAINLANIQTHIVELKNPEKEMYLNGKIVIDERNIHNQIAHYSGRIEKLYINFTGQKVSNGQRIARIYSPELVTAQKELFEAIKLKESIPKLYNSAVEKLKLWKLTDEQINAIETKGMIQEELDILADASGYVVNSIISSGSQVQRGEVMFEIADLRNVWVLFDVYENDINWVRVNDLIDFTITSFPEKVFSTKIKYIDPILNEKDRTIKVRAELRNTNYLLKPEMFVKGVLKSRFPINERKIIIPKTSVIWTGKRSIVYIKLEDTETPSFEMREITLGNNLGEYYVVEDGIKEGEEIVVYGTFKIDASAQLAGKYSSMNKPIKKEADIAIIPDNKKKTPKEFKAQLNQLMESYFELSEAFVASDSKKAKEKIKIFKAKIKVIDMSLLSHKGHKYWMEQLSTIKKESKVISETENIDVQRKAFIDLSEALIRSAKSFGTEKVFYVIHCPMANDNKGANWLSRKNQVINPYFGNMMLNCGEVIEKINN